jgi:AcrR family transcriptional regulator
MPISSTPLGNRSSVTVLLACDTSCVVPCAAAGPPDGGCDWASTGLPTANPAAAAPPASVRTSRRAMLLSVSWALLMVLLPDRMRALAVRIRTIYGTIKYQTQEDSLPPIEKARSAADDLTGRNDPLCNRIIAAAFAGFMENGYGATSMLEIATRAKVSKRDLYASFANKQAVLRACISNRAARMRLPADLPAPASHAMLAATLTRFGATVIREVCEPAVMAMYRLAIAEAVRSPDVATTLKANRFVNRNALGHLLVQAQQAGILGCGEPQQMMEHFFALLWGDLLFSQLLGAARAPTRAEIDRRAKEATATFLRLFDNVRTDQRSGMGPSKPTSDMSA